MISSSEIPSPLELMTPFRIFHEAIFFSLRRERDPVNSEYQPENDPQLMLKIVRHVISLYKSVSAPGLQIDLIFSDLVNEAQLHTAKYPLRVNRADYDAPLLQIHDMLDEITDKPIAS